jgi:2-aminobenzoate-CoA ligase
MQGNIPESYLPDEGPQLVHPLPELHYPQEINVATELVDRDLGVDDCNGSSVVAGAVSGDHVPLGRLGKFVGDRCNGLSFTVAAEVDPVGGSTGEFDTNPRPVGVAGL